MNKIYMNKIYLYPSFYAHIVNALLLFLAFMLLYKNYSKIIHLDPYKQIILTLFFALNVGVHGLSHLGLERNYGYPYL